MPDSIGTLALMLWLMWSINLMIGSFGQLFCALHESKTAELVWRAAGMIHQELWIAVPPGILLGTIHHWHGHSPWLVFFDALSLFNWWYYRNWPDENKWKRRGKKLKDAVAVRAGRLVVVPTP